MLPVVCQLSYSDLYLVKHKSIFTTCLINVSFFISDSVYISRDLIIIRICTFILILYKYILTYFCFVAQGVVCGVRR